MFSALTIIFANVIYAIATLGAGAKIHKCLLETTLRLPMVFFDITPTGRILGRFSSDINGVDSNLPTTFQNMITNFLKVRNFRKYFLSVVDFLVWWRK